MINRKYTSITLSFIGIILVLSGILMFFVPYNKGLSSLHILFGFLLILILVFHINNNKKPLKNYFFNKSSNWKDKVVIIVIMALVFIPVAFSLTQQSGIEFIYNLGEKIKNKNASYKNYNSSYNLIELDVSNGDLPLTVEVLKGKSFRNPLFAIWAEDTSGNYLKTLYISKSIYSSKFNYGIKSGDKWLPGVKRRPEALPVWSFSRNIKSSDGYYTPLENASDLDGATYATPTENFMLKTGVRLDSLPAFKVLFEVNQSFDWNEYFSKNSFPNDSIYSGDGFVGQPALVYSTTITNKQLKYQKHFLLNLEGHSHISGQNGQIYEVSDSLTSSLEIIDRVIVSFED